MVGARIQARGALKQELVRHLRSKRWIRRSRYSSRHGHSRGQIVDAISIRERPAEAEDRAVPGHWEGDLLRGAGNSHVVTLVERRSRFCMLVSHTGQGLVYGGGRSEPARGPTPGGVASLADLGPRTGDGPTQNLHDGDGYAGLLLRSAESLAAGPNENTNGLLRQYLPKNADLSRFSQSELDEIALRLNTRPRQTLGFRTPADKLQASVASTP